METLSRLESLKQSLSNISEIISAGKVTAVKGASVEASGIIDFVTIGSQVKIKKSSSHFKDSFAEVIAINNDKAILMPYGDTQGIGSGSGVYASGNENIIWPDHSWKGRILNAFAKPIDESGLLKNGARPYSLTSLPLNPQKRKLLGPKIDLGVKALDCFTSCCQGQRMGIFAGSGVGKSVLISMLTKFSKTDIKVIGLIGERGREVQEFIQEYLGEDGLKNAVIVVATSDESALMRKRAAYLTMTIAEYFRDQGEEVLCIMDSLTRLAMAQREIGLTAGEPPTTKGYTPSVFSELPRLLERAGPGIDKGNITGLFTVLVDGDDQNEPISDAVRSIIDGHIVLDRSIHERGRYPSVDVLKSVSRALPKCNSEFENKVIQRAKRLLSTYNDMAELIRIGAYKKGSDVMVDEAIKYCPAIEEFLGQKPGEYSPMEESFKKLAEILAIE
jgi:flagellum-specific ATP synthase